jgi:sigma-E factor negative regulatory protein RseA
MTLETSSLMDGELTRAEAEKAIRTCCATPGELDNWHLYHVIGDAMRGQVPRDLAYNNAIRAALDKEPAMIVRPKRVLESSFARVSLAAAASVATIGIVGWIGSQGGAPAGVPVATVKPGIQPAGLSAAQPVSTTVVAPVAAPIDRTPYELAHRQVPRPDVYNVNNKAAATAR